MTSYVLLQASILDNILLVHTWKEVIKEVNMCIVSILHVFNIYFQSTYQHIHNNDCLEYQFPAWSILTRLISFTKF